MRDVKSRSSSWAHENLFENFAWQEGYAAFSVSASNLSAIEKYILNQEAHHAKHDFIEELRALLKKEGVVYDEKYLL